MIREYRNGVITETSPIRIAETIALYPTTPNNTPNIKNRPVLISGQRNDSSKKHCKSNPRHRNGHKTVHTQGKDIQ